MMMGYRRRQIVEYNLMIQGAWYGEMFARQKRVPALKNMLADSEDKPRPKQSMEDMMEVAKMFTIANGGKIVKT